MSREILKNILVILVEPKEPGNIGSTVRAMKNMGITNLRLVNPVEYRDVLAQRKMGYRSQEIIQDSCEYATLKEAVADLSMVFLATVRKGKWKKDFLTPTDAANTILKAGSKEKIGLVFGREDKGVTIDESQSANYYIKIPAAVSYPSLNLSQAVMVILYQIYSCLLSNKIAKSSLPSVAKKKAFNRLTDNIWDLMKSLKFREEQKGLFHRSLIRSLNRTRWSAADIAVFDRFCKQVRWYRDNHPNIQDNKEK